MDNETRQFGSADNLPDPQRKPRPKQYFPEAAPEREETRYEKPQYAEPQYAEPRYAEARYPEPRYEQQTPYEQPQYADTQYTQPQYAEPARQRDNVPAIIFGVLFAIATAAGIVLFFLWRGAAAEANKPPVTVTQTQTQTVTTTATTTKLPNIFGDRDQERGQDSQRTSTPRREPSPRLTEEAPSLELPQDIRDALDGLRGEAESFLQTQ